MVFINRRVIEILENYAVFDLRTTGVLEAVDKNDLINLKDGGSGSLQTLRIIHHHSSKLNMK